MAVFEADLAHKQAKEVFRALITQSLPLSLSLSLLRLPSSSFFSLSPSLLPRLPFSGSADQAPASQTTANN